MFPSPFGVQFFLMVACDVFSNDSLQFPSPFGVQFFLINTIYEYYSDYVNRVFPSPFGVQFFLIYKNIKNIYNKIKEFPSPFGVQFFLINKINSDYLIVAGFRLLSEFNSF